MEKWFHSFDYIDWRVILETESVIELADKIRNIRDNYLTSKLLSNKSRIIKWPEVKRIIEQRDEQFKKIAQTGQIE